MELHEIGLQKEPRLTGTGAANDQNVFVPGMFGILGSVVHGDPFCLGHGDVPEEILVHERCNVRNRAPAGRTVFDTLPELSGILAFQVKQDSLSNPTSCRCTARMS